MRQPLTRTACFAFNVTMLLVTVTYGAEPLTDVIRPFLTTHCVRCHGPEKQQGDLRLDMLDDNFTSSDATSIWTEVMDVLNLGEMPPNDQPRPNDVEQRAVVIWIAGELKAARRRKLAQGGRVLLRRLSRAEYRNTIRDLFHLKFLPGDDPADQLPNDGEFEGFKKVSSALMFDSSLLDNYYAAAKRIADRVIVPGAPPFPTHRSHFEMENMAKEGSGFTYMCHGSTLCGEQDVRLLDGSTRTSRGLLYPGSNQLIPVNGMYTIRVRASGDPGDGKEPPRMSVERVNGREGRIMEVDVTAPRHAPQVYSVTLPLDALPEARGVYMKVAITNGPKRLQPHQLTQPEKVLSVGLPDFFHFEKAMKAAASRGDHAESLRIAARRRSEGWTGSTRPGKGLLDPSHLRKLYIDWIEIEGPLYPQWPPRSHQVLFFKDEATPHDETYARKIFAQFLPRAFRRPIREEELTTVVSLVTAELKQGLRFEDAIRLGIIYTLTSPSFLYLAETAERSPPADTDIRPVTQGHPPLHFVNDYQLANRLSYFIWSSMPDKRLFALAAANRLHVPKVLSAEVDRMLDDPKSRALVDGFAAQWLKTDEFLDFMPDRKIYAQYYRDYGPLLLPAMQTEPLAFFAQILRNDLSVQNFIDSDFVMVNQPLANFYGLPTQRFSSRSAELEFRRVPLPPSSPRGGILGLAGVHLRGSDGVRTKPVNRGAYLREVLFNDPPDPPPPNAGEVEPNIEGQKLTVRERLQKHQQIEACASCHRSIDPYGLALENFDVTGAWRDQQNGENFKGHNAPRIDASGKLPNGDKFTNFPEFKTALLRQRGRFRRAFVEKLFLYALGRPVMTQDRGTIDEIAAQMTNRDDSIRTAIQAIALSRPFRIK